MSNETYLEHIWVSIPARNIKILDDQGYDETIQYEFTKEGTEGFTETLASFKENVPDEMVTFVS
tara:strand:+ start:444 stop:635 length:192 start_codon:yes stop_codon:yes gene_type:complete